MSANIVNQVAFLRTSREFPEDIHQLIVEINKSYIDIANAVNNRTISIFPKNKPAITGESWFLTNQKHQSLRQIYTFDSVIGSVVIDHGIDISKIFGFVKIYGTFTDGTYWFPLPYVVEAGILTNQVSLIVSSTQIFVNRGATAPVLQKGFVVLEWLSQI